MEVFHTLIEADRKIQIPPQVLAHLNWKNGMLLELRIENKSLIVSLAQSENLKQEETPLNSAKE